MTLVKVIETIQATKKLRECGCYSTAEELIAQFKSDLNYIDWECSINGVEKELYILYYWQNICPVYNGIEKR